jgi:hypothetical protein
MEQLRKQFEVRNPYNIRTEWGYKDDEQNANWNGYLLCARVNDIVESIAIKGE